MHMRNLVVIKKVLAREFQDLDSEKLINMLGVIDDMQVLFITLNFHDIQILINILRGHFFLLVKEKMEDE